MFKKKEETVALPIDVETYAVSTGAARIRALEAEMLACFEEWMKAQVSSAEKQLLVEFDMSPWLDAAWRAWKQSRRADFTGGVDEAPTSEIATPEGWPT